MTLRNINSTTRKQYLLMKIKVMWLGDTSDVLLKIIYLCMVISYKNVRIQFCTNVICISVQISNNRTIQKSANKNLIILNVVIYLITITTISVISQNGYLLVVLLAGVAGI